MEPMIRSNTKARVNLACPVCGMNLKKAPNGGFAKYGETYCCQGCADGSGCTCYAGNEVKKSFSRPDDIGWRNADERDHGKPATSSRPIGKGQQATAKQTPSRNQRQHDPRSKRLKTENKPRDSSREQARGRSEERGQLTRRRGAQRNKEPGSDRISRTGSKGK